MSCELTVNRKLYTVNQKRLSIYPLIAFFYYNLETSSLIKSRAIGSAACTALSTSS
jgi:hypothetical protein